MTYTVYVAGTFNVLTEGHKKLLKTAVDSTEGYRYLAAYVTADGSLYTRNKEVPVRDSKYRCGDVRRFLTRECGLDEGQFGVFGLHGWYGNMDIPWSRTDILVCSSETRANAESFVDTIPESKRPKLVVLERDPSMPSSTQIIQESLERPSVTVVR